uniref:Disease resistance protein RGA2 n=2 Tax=Rhizophora mucronata TaxID=61149 RepID=A0A2P2LYQ2_RHIMU
MPQWRKWVSYAHEDGGEAFPRLRELYIRKCPNVTGDLPCHIPSLTTVIIEECQQLVTSLPSSPAILKLKIVDDSHDVLLEKLPSGLHHLRVDRFDGSNSLLEGIMLMESLYGTLEEIEIRDCDSLKCIPLELFPKLKTVQLTKCPNLKSLFASEWIHGGFPSLVSLEIKDCPNLVSFPKGGLRAPNLTHLWLQGCSSLKSLPEKMHSLLPCLVSLKIDNCPELDLFPDGGLPSKLELLEVYNCNKLIAARTRWNLRVLACLSCFKIGVNKDVEFFPEETLLPSSLTSLTISNLQNLKYLDCRGFHHLTSVRELTIIHCPKLQCMPEDGLPSSLFSLIVYNCPLLEKRCQQDKGEDWPKIALIPHIEINLPKTN